MKRKKAIYISLTIVISSLLVTFYYFTKTMKSKTPKNDVSHYQVIQPIVQDTSFVQEYVAEINAFKNVEIRSRLSGFIESILVDEGEYVKKDQPLFRLSNKQFQQDLLKAKAETKNIQAELHAVEIELNGAKRLLDKKFIAQTEYDLIQAKLDALNAQIEEAKLSEEQALLNLSFSTIKAPFDGFINRIPNKEGSLVEEGSFLTSISNNKEMFAYFNVSEVDYLKLSPNSSNQQNKQVSLILADGSKYPFKGIVETTESEFDRNTGTIAFRAKFPNPDNHLKHGISGKVQMETPLKDATLIPQKCTFDRQENLCVFVLQKDSTVSVRQIIPLARLPRIFVIESGLSSKETILFEGIQHLKEGDRIIPEKISFQQVSNF